MARCELRTGGWLKVLLMISSGLLWQLDGAIRKEPTNAYTYANMTVTFDCGNSTPADKALPKWTINGQRFLTNAALRRFDNRYMNSRENLAFEASENDNGFNFTCSRGHCHSNQTATLHIIPVPKNQLIVMNCDPDTNTLYFTPQNDSRFPVDHYTVSIASTNTIHGPFRGNESITLDCSAYQTLNVSLTISFVDSCSALNLEILFQLSAAGDNTDPGTTTTARQKVSPTTSEEESIPTTERPAQATKVTNISSGQSNQKDWKLMAGIASGIAVFMNIFYCS